MRRRSLVAIGLTFALALTAAAGSPIELLRGKLALERARVMANKELYARALALFKTVAATHPALAPQAKALLATVAQRAAADTPSNMPDHYQKALELAKHTGRPVMLFLGRPTERLCEQTKASLADPKLAPLLRRLIEVQMSIDEAVNRPLVRRFAAGKDMKTLPFIFYVSSDEELLDHTAGQQDAAKLAETFRGVLAQAGSAMDPQKRARAEQALEKANALMDAGRCGQALAAYSAIAALKLKCPLVREAKTSIGVIDEVADTLFGVARQAAGTKNYGAIVPALLLLQSDFAGTRAADRAARELETIKADPKGRHAIEQVTAMIEKASKPTPPAAAPKPKPKPSADAARAASMLRMARNFLQNKRPDLARTHLERLLKQYPDTDAAKEARELLKTID